MDATQLVERRPKSAAELHLPHAPIPRPGERVVFYNGSYRGEGVIECHGEKAKPHIRTDFSNTTVLDSFETIRPADPINRKGAAWHYLPPTARIVSPTIQEEHEFDNLLNRRIPPGPRYIDVIEEIWARGFEVFVVGGTVRDVISGHKTHDVDLVTTMPLSRAAKLLDAMFCKAPEIREDKGYVRLGGTPASRDPFIDLKMFSQFSAGCGTALFGANFELDIAHRDFDCNAIYYDPINKALIDPTGNGIVNAEGLTLALVCDPRLRNANNLAQIVIRFFKFKSRGYSASNDTCVCIKTEFIPSFPSMKTGARIAYIRAQILSKYPSDQKNSKFEEFRVQFIEFGMEDLWNEHIEPHRQQILA